MLGINFESEPEIVTPRHPQTKNTTQMQVVQASFLSGPLPHPELLGKYNDVVQNGAERIVQMAEKQQMHRHDLERSVIHGNVNSERRGQAFGLIIAVLGLVAATYLGATGKQITGGIIGTVDIVSLASVFVIGKRAQQKELADKNLPFRKR